MSEQEAFRSRPSACSVVARESSGNGAMPAPCRNRILAALPPDAYRRLAPWLEPVPLPLGSMVHRPGEREKHVHFLTAGIVSRVHVTENGASAEFAITGREGMIGVATFLGGESMPNHTMVLSAGRGYRLPARVIRREFGHDGPLPRLLLRYTLALIAQTGQISACNRRHPLEQRLCRWILSCLDRLPSRELTMTQAVIADVLGVRREGVTEAVGALQKAGLIHCGRSHIDVLDRPGLEARVCECYGILQEVDDRLLSDYLHVVAASRESTRAHADPARHAEDARA